MPNAPGRSAHPTTTAAIPTANDLMKQRARAWLPRSLVLAVIVHAAVLSLTPELSVADMSADGAPDLLVVPPPVKLPLPPEPIERPAKPIVGSLDVKTDITVPVTRWDAYQPEQLAAPRETGTPNRETFERFVRSMVAPSLRNPEEVEHALMRHYPPVLRDAGIGGEVDVNLWLDEEGRVVRAEIARSSGYDALDAAALKVIDVMRLSPALNRGVPARVIVTLPVVFNVRS